MTNKLIYLFILLFFIGCEFKQKEISGEKLYIENNCITCHSIDGSIMLGPTLKGIFGKTVELSNGDKIVADEKYLYESIVNPSKDIVKNYPDIMTPYKKLLSDDEINALIKYIKSLKP
tara:strand:+ start:413 stop:766 length:354 start_codon:yes stop_codon:yes gene_type:complete